MKEFIAIKLRLPEMTMEMKKKANPTKIKPLTIHSTVPSLDIHNHLQTNSLCAFS